MESFISTGRSFLENILECNSSLVFKYQRYLHFFPENQLSLNISVLSDFAKSYCGIYTRYIQKKYSTSVGKKLPVGTITMKYARESSLYYFLSFKSLITVPCCVGKLLRVRTENRRKIPLISKYSLMIVKTRQIN